MFLFISSFVLHWIHTIFYPPTLYLCGLCSHRRYPGVKSKKKKPVRINDDEWVCMISMKSYYSSMEIQRHFKKKKNFKLLFILFYLFLSSILTGSSILKCSLLLTLFAHVRYVLLLFLHVSVCLLESEMEQQIVTWPCTVIMPPVIRPFPHLRLDEKLFFDKRDRDVHYNSSTDDLIDKLQVFDQI